MVLFKGLSTYERTKTSKLHYDELLTATFKIEKHSVNTQVTSIFLFDVMRGDSANIIH